MKQVITLAMAFSLAIPYAAARTPDRPGYLDKVGDTLYLEQVTPSGSVPPARGVLTIQDTPEPEPLQPGTTRLQQETNVPTTGFDESAVSSFASAYRKAGKPRLAVYFNRELSDEVREKVISDRQVWEHNTHIQGSRSGKPAAELNINSKSSSYEEYGVGVTGLRDDPSESWKWEFEDNVTQALLSASANVVDRSTILRQTSANRGNTAGYGGNISTNINEMRALDKYADILIELLVVPSSNSRVGYNFKATAKYIKTGRVVGSAFVDGRSNPNPVKTSFVATDSGYSKETTQEIPSISDLSRVLSQKLMRVMSQNLK